MLEELKIYIDELNIKCETITNEVDALNNYDNTPDENYKIIQEKLNEWDKKKYALKVLYEIHNCIISNKANVLKEKQNEQ